MYTLRFHFVSNTFFDAKHPNITENEAFALADYAMTHEYIKLKNSVVNTRNVTMIEIIEQED